MGSDDEAAEVPWRPLHVRSDHELAQAFDVPTEGVPLWLEPSLLRWMQNRVTSDSSVVERAERHLRVTMRPPHRAGPWGAVELYWSGADDDARLALVDFLLHDLEEKHQEWERLGRWTSGEEFGEAAIDLARIVDQAGSAWVVDVEPYWSLVRRVSKTSREAVELAASSSGDAGRLLANAWHACYRHRPNYGAAYGDAVLAVEAAAGPVITPRDPRPSLGKMVAHLKDTADRWTVARLNAPDKAGSGGVLLAMLRLLWHNDRRHTGQGGGAPSQVARSEAEAGVGLAVTLVQWFSTGLVRRIDETSA